jgi:hypothetical protein
MAKQSKPIHMICILFHGSSKRLCDIYANGIRPIETTIKCNNYNSTSIGTFDPKKVTCKKCLKNSKYKEVLEKANNPLFYWKEQL